MNLVLGENEQNGHAFCPKDEMVRNKVEFSLKITGKCFIFHQPCFDLSITNILSGNPFVGPWGQLSEPFVE